MTYSWIAARALHTEVVPYEVTSLMSFFGLVFFFLFYGVWDNTVYLQNKEEISRASKCL